ncbi:NAD-dependent formate dehydrogenase alpha subunit [hydrothermal vent metagenome]|uniref:NAD-dependent formate dehydrogenase alpha subunit n=1 Tax=hydrothermal vent metagenome TaxID=652676 RepID=A0A3B1EA80_9ZZZZ
MQEIASVCTYCGVGCDITAVVDENKIQKIYAQADGYVSRGKLCIKGKSGYDFVHSQKRVKDVRIKKAFIDKNFESMPRELKARSRTLQPLDDIWYVSNYEFATSLCAWKLSDIKEKYGRHAFSAMGGARTSCESAYSLQKFARVTMDSPNIDNCARVCHSPSLSGMRQTIGEGAATNPYDDIFKSEFLLVIGSNTTEAHPIVANRMIEASRAKTCEIAVLDVRRIQLNKYATYEAIMPFEANLLILNMLCYVIIKEELYCNKFIENRTVGFEDFKQKILDDKYANPKFFKKLKGYEELAQTIPSIARAYASKRSMLFWGLGITEHLDGSYAVMALTHLALMTGNIGKEGAGLMPLRGQNNVQGACDVGCLPYYDPDYQTPKEVGLMTPDAVDAMIDGKIKSLYVMGEDFTHIHPNQNKVHQAIKNLELIIVQDLFMNDIALQADIVFGVKSAYEKTGVYINAMRRLHLSQPLVKTDIPDDWEVLRDIENKIKGEFLYQTSEDVWNDIRIDASYRFSGASYQKLTKHRSKGMQWPIGRNATPILHIETFRTKDGIGRFKYHQYKLREQVKRLLNNEEKETYYLTTGRTIVHYNNAAQTMHSDKLLSKHTEDILQISIEDKDTFSSTKVILKNKYGQTNPLKIKFVKTLKTGTMFCTFHHALSHINYIFGDESDEVIKTARFKSVEVEIEQI